MTIHRMILLPLCLALCLASCAGHSPMNQSKSPKFRVIGYVTASVVIETVPFDKLTHINYAFLIPNADGTFQMMPNTWKLQSLAEKAREHGVKVLISVGG